MAKKQPPLSPPDPDAKPKPPRRLKPAVLIGLIVAVAMLLSALGTWLAFRKDSPEVKQEASSAAAEAVAPSRLPAVYEPLMPAFVINYEYKGRQRYLQVSMALMGRDGAGMAKLKAHMPVLRNRLVLLLAGQDFEVLSTPAGKESLRQQITADVQALAEAEIGTATVEQVLFTNFVLQ